ncbi:MAG: YceI family protein [Burkholderiaceae bacterium]
MKYMRLNTLRWIWMVMLMAGFVSGCVTSTPPRQISSTPLPAEFPESYYRQAEALGKKVLHVRPEESLITIEVRRAGTLARLGHDHVVASHDIGGYVAPDEGRADFILPLIKLAVDEPGLRAKAGFDTQPSPEAIEGTRNNMLTKVLDVDHFPFVFIHAVLINSASPMLRVSITLHGMTRNYDVPVQIDSTPTSLSVHGDLSFTQSEFGIVPFSILGGAIQVQDRLDLHFRIAAYER